VALYRHDLREMWDRTIAPQVWNQYHNQLGIYVALVDGRGPLDVLIAHARDEVVPPSQFKAGVPADLERVILRCLAKNPDDRFQDAASLEQALSECAAAGQWTQSDATEWWQANVQEAVRDS
jgi:serine/threonine-protein kinase